MILSIAIIARDEERHIGDALASAAGLADEVVVLVDDRTSDRTAEICASAGARVHILPWTTFPAQRNRALSLCSGAWVLFLDADERLTCELRDELAALRRRAPDDSACAGYWIPRYNYYFGRRLRGGGWYPDHQLRLLRRGRARYDESRTVHELVQLDGPTGYLQGHLLHINIERLAELCQKERRYAIIRAQNLYEQGIRARWRNLALQPPREVWRRFVTWRGYRDGALGLFLAVTLGYYEWVCYVHLKALEQVT